MQDYTFALFVVRCLAFTGSFTLLLRRIVPFSVSFSLILCQVLFFLPMVGNLSLGVSKTVSLEAGLIAALTGGLDPVAKLDVISFSAVVFELLLGSLLGLILAAAAYTARLAASWVGALFFRPKFEEDDSLIGLRFRDNFQVFFLLVFLCLFVETQGFYSLFEVFGRLFIFSHPGVGVDLAHQTASSNLLTVFFNLSATILGSALYILFPMFAAVVLCELLFMVVHRFFSPAVCKQVPAMARMLILVVVLLLSFYPLSRTITVIGSSSVDSNKLDRQLEKVFSKNNQGEI